MAFVEDCYILCPVVLITRKYVQIPTFSCNFVGVFFQLGNKEAIHIVSVSKKSPCQFKRRMKMSPSKPEKSNFIIRLINKCMDD